MESAEKTGEKPQNPPPAQAQEPAVQLAPGQVVRVRDEAPAEPAAHRGQLMKVVAVKNGMAAVRLPAGEFAIYPVAALQVVMQFDKGVFDDDSSLLSDSALGYMTGPNEVSMVFSLAGMPEPAKKPDDKGFRRSWAQIATTGKFESQRYGKFAITDVDLQQILHNFRNVMPKSPTQLPMDYNHGSMAPRTPEEGKAAGWFAGPMELRKGPQGRTELWAEIEWTPAAADAIERKEYQFVSPSFVKKYKHSTGQEIGTTLLAAAITNHPFLEGMARLSLCRCQEEVSMDGQSQASAAPAGIAAKDVNGNDVMISKDELMRIMSEMDLGKAHEQSAMTPEQEAAKKKEDEEKMKGEGKVIVNASLIEGMSANLETVKAENAELKKRLDESDQRQYDTEVESKIISLSKAGIITKKEADWAREEFKTPARDRARFDRWVKAQPDSPVLSLNKEHGSGETSHEETRDEQVEGAGDKLMNLAKSYAKDNGVSFGVALGRVSIDNPELADQYRERFAPGNE